MKTRALLLVALGGCGLFPSLDGLSGGDASTFDAASDVAPALDAADEASVDALDEPLLDAPDEPVCDATTCGGTCVDLDTSSTHCGACGHDCLGAACTAGRCATTVLVTGENAPYDLAADTGHVFWSDKGSGQVVTCSVTNCNATHTVLATFGVPDDVAIDANNVYWSETGGNVFACARAGCSQSPTPLASGQAGIDGIATANGIVYWSTSTAVMKCAATGCGNAPSSFLAHATDDLAVAGTTFFASAGANVYACTLPSCTNLVAIGSSAAEGIASDGKTIFFTSTNGGVFDCPVGGCATASTFAASPYPGDVVTDGKNVYWVDESLGTGRSCPVAGCNGTPLTLATGLSGPKGVAIDDQRVYFADTGGGRIVWVAKL